jgi:hypothetical protein
VDGLPDPAIARVERGQRRVGIGQPPIQLVDESVELTHDPTHLLQISYCGY